MSQMKYIKTMCVLQSQLCLFLISKAKFEEFPKIVFLFPELAGYARPHSGTGELRVSTLETYVKVWKTFHVS
jgi:hypothetical protein